MLSNGVANYCSFKQPDDLTLARMMDKFARRAGFSHTLQFTTHSLARISGNESNLRFGHRSLSRLFGPVILIGGAEYSRRLFLLGNIRFLKCC